MKKLITVAIIALFLCGGCKVMGLNFSMESLDTEEVANETEGVAK